MSYGISNPLNPATDFHTERYDELLISGVSFYALPVRVPANTTLKRGLLLNINSNNYEGVSDPSSTNVFAVLMQDLTNNGSAEIFVTAQVAVGEFKFDKLFVLSGNQCVPVTPALLTDLEIANLAVRNIVIQKAYK